MKRLILYILCFLPVVAAAQDDKPGDLTVTGAIQHESLFPTTDVSGDRQTDAQRADWAKTDHLSNSYLDLGIRYDHYRDNKAGFRGIALTTRLELTQWPMLGYETGFAGHGIGHLDVAMDFNWGKITFGDVYAQFGSGYVLRLYEERSLGVDNALRGAKFDIYPYKGIEFTLLGGKQRRYWNMYDDDAWGFNYRQEAVLGANMELGLSEWIPAMQEAGANLTLGGSYVSKYDRDETILTIRDNQLLQYNLPEWVGAGDMRVQLQMKGWNALVEYARKANDPNVYNDYSYRPGEALMMSLSYSQKGMSFFVQAKHSENMYFRTDRTSRTLSGNLSHMPAFANQHTYALAALYPYATQYATGEWAFQGEIRYTFARNTKMGGKYGTTLKLHAAHVRGLGEQGGWSMNTAQEGTYYTDVHLELNKKINKQWYIAALAMYQTYNSPVIDKECNDIVRSGIFVAEAKYQTGKNVSMRAELQYLYSAQYYGQWIFALYELNLWKQLTLSGQWMYNIGHADHANNEHYYTVSATYTHGAHRLMAGYTKTRAGYNCAGGVCRYVPKQEGANITYNFTW